MKKLILFFTLLTTIQLSNGFISANENLVAHLLVEDNKQWNILHTDDYLGVGEPECRTEVVYLKGDTVINNIAYIKMYHSFYRDKTFSSYIGAMRQQEGKVYIIDIEDKEELLYDFDLAIGDIVKVKTQEMTVTQIKEVDYYGMKRKVYSFNYMGGYIGDWIEGIGSPHGVLYPEWWFIDGGGGKLLLSCQHEENVLYKDDSKDEDFIQRPFLNFFPEDTKWIDAMTCSLDDEEWGYIEYEFKGDTLVDRVYWKLYANGQFIGGMCEDRYGDVYIRNMTGEDSRIFYDLKNDTTYLLYSFDDSKWVVGGKFKYLLVGEMREVTISELKYITLEDGEEYKYVDNIIYSIGSSYGIFDNVYPHTTCWRSKLLEYSRGGKLLYKSQVNSIDDVQGELVKVYTNTSGQTVFSLENNSFYCSVRLFNMEGQLVYSGSVEGQSELVVSGLVKGLYMYKIEGKDSKENVYGKVAVFF